MTTGSREVINMSDKKNEPHHHHKEHTEPPDRTKHEDALKKETKATETQNAEPPIDTAEDLRQQLEAQSDRYLRLMAEFDNFKKRVSRDYERLVDSANEKLMASLIDVRENLERAVKSGDQCADAETMLDGMRLIFTKFNDILFKNGLDTFGAVGELFDPQLHDALMKVPDKTVTEDHIVEIFEKGYTLKKHVIKHAKVVVSSGAAERTATTKDEESPEC
jgi:molecular chaperone GrpE